MFWRCVSFVSSRFGFLVVIVVAASGIVGGVPSAVAATQAPFPMPGYLKPRVGFWVKVFSKYSSRDFIIHDGNDVWRIYGVLHLPGSGAPTREQAEYADSYLTTKYRQILNSLADGEPPLTPSARRVAAMFHNATPAEYREAANNLVVQEGVRDNFRRGMIRSLRYRGMMQRIFAEQGLPRGLIFLAAVESEFDPYARSYAGAVGIWQFIASTGRRYLTINRWHDDRLDPVLATLAAAKLLRSHYEKLGSWPLAITAYDYGSEGMMRAAAVLDGSYRRILEDWNGPGFGYAAKNYYSEFLAALQIYQHSERYFPGLNLPGDTADETTMVASAGPVEPRPPARIRPMPPAVRMAQTAQYRVQPGDTLSRIAQRYRVSVVELADTNDVRDARALRVGSLLSIPGVIAGEYAAPERTDIRYRVQPGDTLFRIARLYRVSVVELRRANGVQNARTLRPGSVLSIPGGHAPRMRAHYRVRPGDTLFAIAQRSGVPVKRLMEANQLDDPRALNIGTVLVIPGV